MIGLLFADSEEVLEKSVHRMSLIQSWIIYTGGLGGVGAGGTGCTMATGFSVFIYPISLSVTSRLSVGKTKLYIMLKVLYKVSVFYIDPKSKMATTAGHRLTLDPT